MLARFSRSLLLRFSSKSIFFSNQQLSSSRLPLHFSLAFHSPLSQHLNQNTSPILDHRRSFSSNQGAGGGNGDDSWRFNAESEDRDSVFDLEQGNLAGIEEDAIHKVGIPWDEKSPGDVFEGIDVESKDGGKDVVWETAEGYKPWSLGEEDGNGDIFGGEEDLGTIEGFEGGDIDGFEKDRSEEQEKLQQREEELLDILHGPNRAFGDLIAASGITEDMIDSLILLKDVRGVKGLPPLSEIEDKAIAKLNATSTRAEVERKKQEEITKARVRKVDNKGRAYGTGRRKCSVARVWVQPGDGKFMVNDKQFDAYFPILDHRADLLRPFTVTNTLGLWDVTCTVKGGGVSGQVGAVRLGISRALQNWEPGLRSYLKAAGFLTRDPRAVERKKPGKAKARKSFQWVKR